MKQSVKTVEYVFVLLFLVFTENVTGSMPVEASPDPYQTYLPVVARSDPYYAYLPALARPLWHFFLHVTSDYFSGILPPKYATGTQTGPEGGTVTALAFTSKGVIYAGSWGSGVFKSINHGSTWTFSNRGLENGFVYSLAVDPINPNILYAGTYYSGVYKSTDGGLTWNPTGPGLNPSAVVYALAVNPQQPNIIFAGTRGNLTLYNTPYCHGLDSGGIPIYDGGGGVYRSKDGGATWAQVDGGLACGYVYGLAIDPNNPKLVYVATHQVGVLRSINGGTSFQKQNTALGDQSTRSIVVDPTDSNRLYVSTWHGGAVYVGTDHPNDNGPDGIIWNTANGGASGILGLHILKVAVDPSSYHNYCALLYALILNGETGLASSSDCGVTWKQVGPGPFPRYNYDLAIDPSAPNNLYIGMSIFGIYKTTDRGLRWNSANQGLYNTSVNTLVVDPSAPATFYAGTTNGSGIFKSQDSGATWTPINRGLPTSPDLYPSILKIAADPLTPGTLYAGTDGGGIYKSTNGGAFWSPVDNGVLAAVSVEGMSDPSSPLLPHSVPYDGPFFDGADGVGVKAPVIPPLKTGSIPALVVDTLIPGVVYPGSWEGVLASENGGASWAVIGLAGQPVFSLAIDPSTPTVIYAGTLTGVYKTLDGGETWDAAGLPEDLVYDLAVDATNPLVIYAATGGEGVFKSEDSGATWFSLNQGLTDYKVYSVAIDPVHPEFQYAGTASGLFRTTLGGTVWEAVNTGIFNTYGDPVTVNPATPGIIYLGTNSGVRIVKFSDSP